VKKGARGFFKGGIGTEHSGTWWLKEVGETTRREEGYPGHLKQSRQGVILGKSMGRDKEMKSS